ncbi:MAG: amino acid adenylation domain-containing protein [Usitatibacteraceae bacterium]
MHAPAVDNTLIDACGPGRGDALRDTVTRIERMIRPTLAEAVRRMAGENGWSADSVYLAAWLIVVDRVQGQGKVRLREHDSQWIAPHQIITVDYEVPGDLTSSTWIAGVDKHSRQVDAGRDDVAVEAVEYLWLRTGQSWLTPPAAPLLIGVRGGEVLTFSAACQDSVIEGTAVSALVDCALSVVDSFVQSPERKLRDIQVLCAEQQAFLTKWNPPGPAYDKGKTIDRLFRERAAISGDRVALAWDGGEMSYRELDVRSTSVMHRLGAAGIAKGEVVGVALDRSPEALVVLLGILKAGSAYLPIDLKYPVNRVAFMLQDARANWVVTTEGGRGSVGAGAKALNVTDLVSVDREVGSRSDNFESVTDGDTCAYVMYTSGSTGEPKGIEICHRSIVRLVQGVDYVELGNDVAFLHAAPLGFDASTLEIWGPLLNGGRCVLHHETVPTGPGLAQSIRKEGVNAAWLTAALFNAVADDSPAYLGGLKQLLIGGEALSVPHVVRALKALPGIALINGYGPTECTTFTATYRIPHDVDPLARSIPIGRPISQTSVYVVNQRMQQLPVGLVGELCVGGPGLARGYLRRAELTAERFVPNPFGPAGDRLYRTGDLVRYLPDGNIEFIGRRDGQVKIRGFRIEVGEIEAALARFPGVKACAVVARDDQPGGARLVAYVVASAEPPAVADLRAHLLRTLPEFMVPANYVTLPLLPVTENGKLDRRALPAPENRRPEIAQAYLAPLTELEEMVCRIFSGLLGLDRVGRLDNFFEVGGNSLLVMQALHRLKHELGRPIAATVFFRDPTPAAIAGALDDTRNNSIPLNRMSRNRADDEPRHGHEAIAIIAMAGRFPGAANVEGLWKNLCEGLDTITFFDEKDIDPAVPVSTRDDPQYVKGRGIIDGVEMFDAPFFGISPREAELMDPQQRIFLEICWEALERGGYAPDSCPGPVGVFGGMYNASYYQRHVLGYPEQIAQLGEFQVMLANEKDYITTRVANKLSLTGPAISVHTACSTSLVAIVQAVTSLRSGQCDMALAGGASITCPPRSGYLYQEGAMLSPDGHTRTFDASAQGTVFSDGAAVVLLKRLSDALSDGDPIFAVIRGAAVNNDGGAKASFTAPSVDGQAAVIAAALEDAGVDARSIDYVEAHGTATPLGDPVELEALGKAFRRHTADTGFCRIGSVKSNFGHLVIAAGATGVIKTALALAEESIPASLHFNAPNPEIDFANSPFVVNGERSDWKRQARPRLAGVSAFGVGGTNAHVILEESPVRQASDVANGPQLLLVSARTSSALGVATENLAAHLATHPSINFADVAHTLRIGRKNFSHRACVVASSASDAARAFREPSCEQKALGVIGAKPPSVAFMFPGQGAQYASMGKALYAAEPEFKEAFDACLRALEGVVPFDLKEKMFSGDAAALTETAITQPALFCVEYALAKYWLASGLRPKVLIGHSVGEYVAATIAGVFALDDAARLVARRGALMQSMPTGAMLAVRAPFERIQARMPEHLALAAENSPGLCVVAGPFVQIEALRVELEREQVVSRLLQTSHAFHSPMMEPAIAPFEAEIRQVRLSPPTIQIFSTVTARLLSDEEACDPGYWARHLREPVRFSSALLAMLAAADCTLLEVGPRSTLTTLARQHGSRERPAPLAIASLTDSPEKEREALLLAAGRLWTMGVPLSLDKLDRRPNKQRLLLPTYPFERQRYWLEAKSLRAQTPTVEAIARPPIQQSQPLAPTTTMSTTTAAPQNRVPQLINQLRSMLEDTSGVDMEAADPGALFVELGLDSLSLTQIAIQLKQTFKVNITFRQLMENYRTLSTLAAHLDAEMPAASAQVAANPIPPSLPQPSTPVFAGPAANGAASTLIEQVIQQQMQLMAQQIALLQGNTSFVTAPPPLMAAPPAPVSVPPAAPVKTAVAVNDEEAATGLSKYDVKKAFGAIARIHTDTTAELTERQQARLDTFIRRYVARTAKSKEYTQTYRAHLADPRVVNGFRPLLKEMIYQIVIGRSKGSRLWDIDGNEYVDVLNGFGMNLFGWQPPFVDAAIRKQLDEGYEIGPQHPLAGEVAKLVCEMTGFDRAGLCNTGSEAVMGAVRVARTVTGRNLIALFTGSYHGIFDEVIVRATKKLRAVPAAPGIMPSTAQNVIVLDYGTPESMEILKSRAHELAAVLVEPVQSRRPDFQPREFLHELRKVTQDAGTLLILDEVVTGFRCHPGGIQALFDIRADLCTYGKVVGGGFPIGVIAGKREFMDALDGGSWQFGDDSIPTVGVTYFAGTFVRHPLALAAAKAVLTHLKEQGPELQVKVTRNTTEMVEELNAFCRDVGAPIVLKSFASVWKTFFTEEHPLQDLLFAMMRSRGIHILDNFPCFFTTAHTSADIELIKTAFKESVTELQEADFIPRSHEGRKVELDAARPPMPGARIGKDPDGKPAWFVPNPDSPGKYLRLQA